MPLPPEPGAVSGLLVDSAVQTQPTRPCGSPDCSAFAHVSLVLTLSHTVRAPLLLAYASWFASLVFLVSDAGEEPCAQCRAAVRANATAANRHRVGCFCIEEWTRAGSIEECSPLNISWSAVRHTHYAALFKYALSLAVGSPGDVGGGGGRRSRGVLLTHADMFLNVRLFHGAAFDAPWLASGGLPLFGGADAQPRELPVPRCYRVASRAFERDRSWFWFDHAKPRCRAAVEALGGTECCFGWADLLYVPRARLAPFGATLAAFPGVHRMPIRGASLRPAGSHLICDSHVLGAMSMSGQTRWPCPRRSTCSRAATRACVCARSRAAARAAPGSRLTAFSPTHARVTCCVRTGSG